MKTTLFFAVLISVLFANNYAFAQAVGAEKCWSAAPVLKPISESKKADDEAKLCGLKFYNDKYSLCPKLNSTNPGVLIVKRPENISDDEFTQKYCTILDDVKKTIDYKVVAKFKQSTSCSYTASPVAYYRIAEFLGGIKAPVAVFRTMDRAKHLEITTQAHDYLLAHEKPTEPIYQTWATVWKLHQAAPANSDFFVENGTMVYGALSENIKGEYIYTEVSGVGPYATRYERFVQQRPFLNVANEASVPEISGGENFVKLAPVVRQMADVSNMIIIDHMLNQADRIGNIHFKYKWYSLVNNEIHEDPSDAVYNKKRQDEIPDAEKANISAGKVLVKEMILKDNDCGIIKDNNMKKIGALAKIKHVSPSMYVQVQKLAKFVSTAQGADYFKKELRIPNDAFLGNKWVSGIKNNIIEVARVLKTNCENGSLKVDLNLIELLHNPNYKASCTAE